METKICRECGEELPLDKFYSHRNMLDGHLNVCKDCVKDRIARHRLNNLEKIHAYDNERSKLPRRKALRKKAFQKYVDAGKKKATSAVGNAIRDKRLERGNVCQACGSPKAIEAHHFNYDYPLKVIWLCRDCHRQYHLGKTERAKMVQNIVNEICKLYSTEVGI